MICNVWKLKLLFTIGLILFSFLYGFTQETITGRVVDEEGQPMVGVTIVSLPSSQGNLTDTDGYFTMSISPQDTAIDVSYIGHERKIISLPLIEKTIILEEGSDLICGEIPSVFIIARPETSERELSHIINLTARPAEVHTSADEVLNAVPGVYMQSGSPNTKRLTIRGSGNRSAFASSGVKVFIDDIPIHGNNGESTIEDFGTHLISKAEVIKGPTGPAYGSGLGGALVLRSDDGLYSEKTYLSSHNEVGPYGLFRTANSFEYTSKPQGITHRLRLQHGYLHSDGYRDNNIVDRNNLTLSYRMKSGNHTLRLLANRVDLDGQIPSALGITDYTDTPRKAAFIWDQANGYEDYTRSLAGLSYTYKFALESSLSATLYTKGFSSTELRPFNTLQEELGTLGARVKVDHIISLASGSLSLEGGLDLQTEDYDIETYETLDSVQGSLIGLENYTSTNTSPYISADYYLDNGWQFNVGFAYSHYMLSKDEEEKLNVGGLFPTATISKKIGPTKYFVSGGRGGQFPASGELTNVATDLGAVTGLNIETGLKGYDGDLDISYRLSFYNMWVADQFIQDFTDTGEPFFRNGGSSVLRGLEWSLRKRWIDNNYGEEYLESSISGSYAHHVFDDFIDNNNDYSRNDYTGTPPLTILLRTDYHSDRWSVGLSAQHVDGFAINDANSAYSEAYTIVNAYLSYAVVTNEHWKITLGTKLQNALDEKYASMISVNARSFGGEPRYYYPGLPQNILGNINVKYTL